MTVTRARGRMSPSGQSRIARRCCSNWLVVAPSIDQWPELCGRIASSLTTRPLGASNSSTAITPTTPSSLAIVVAIRSASAASDVLSRGAGATTSTQIPLRWTVSTTGQQRT